MASKGKTALPAQPLAPLMIERSQLLSEARQRRDPNVYKSIHIADEDDVVRDKWVSLSEGRRHFA
jgi:hypothetical protein